MFQNIKDKFKKAWSIGVYTGESPFILKEYNDNPVLSAKDVKDKYIYFIADPFLFNHNNKTYMFFEMLNAKTGLGEIGVASSMNCTQWSYEKTALSEDFHLSYPLVFKWKQDYFMIPETMQKNAVRLYISKKFPYEWKHEMNILEHKPYRDSTIFYYNNKWWLYTTYDDYNLRLYYSDIIISKNWYEHPSSPILKGRYARPGGRVIFYNNRIIRFSQDSFPYYGCRVIAYEVKVLTTTEYIEELIEPNPFMAPSGKGWNKSRVHHVDCYEMESNKWVVAVDGFSEEINLSLKIGLHRIYQKLLQYLSI
jgi:hypothetical protein